MYHPHRGLRPYNNMAFIEKEVAYIGDLLF